MLSSSSIPVHLAIIFIISSACIVSLHSSRSRRAQARASAYASASSQGTGSAYSSASAYSWGRHIHWSTPEECARQCVDGEPPRYCYYHFKTEFFTTMGPGCDLCKSNVTNQLSGQPLCECIEGDGFEKTVLTINRMLPGPSIQVCLHDRVVIDLENSAEGLEITLHWHGLWQNGYQYYDGVPYITQCPVMSGNTFRYQFAADNSGTHMYHSHVSVHMIDGQYGSLIVRDPPQFNPLYSLYDLDLPEHAIAISDWMHSFSLERLPGRFRHKQGQAAENILINGMGKDLTPTNDPLFGNPSFASFVVEPGKRYRFRLIGALSTVCTAHFRIEGHDLLVIAQDGEDIEPVVVDTIYFSSGDRVDFVLHANQTVRSYWIQVTGLGECAQQKLHQLGILIYSGSPVEPPTSAPQYDALPKTALYNPLYSVGCDENPMPTGPFQRMCINNLKSIEEPPKRLMQVKPDIRIILPFWFYSYNNSLGVLFGPESYRRFIVAIDKDTITSMVSNISYSEPHSPPLSQNVGYERMCNPGHTPTNCAEPCTCSHVYHIEKDAVVEVVIYDAYPQLDLQHPFHLHGYAFSVFVLGQFADNRNITTKDMDQIIAKHEDRLRKGQYDKPSKKDTLMVPQAGYTIVRFIANNPGWWLYHCHFLWHTVSGMDVVLHVGDRNDLPPVPINFPTCYSWTPEPDFPIPNYDYDYDYNKYINSIFR